MGFKSWFKDGMKDAFKDQVELEFIAGQTYLAPKMGAYFKKTQMYEEKDGGVKIAVPGEADVFADVLDIQWEENYKRSGGKAAGGAVAGGLVGGVVGAAAGAAVGGRRKDASSAIILLYNRARDEEFELHVKCDQDKYAKISSFKSR